MGGEAVIDHAGISVSDWDKAKAFYDTALAPLGATLLYVVPEQFTGGVKVAAMDAKSPSSGCMVLANLVPDGIMRSGRFTRQLLRPAAATTARPACARIITNTITAPSCWTQTATTSKPSVTGQSERTQNASCFKAVQR
jgi:hypothetical protein